MGFVQHHHVVEAVVSENCARAQATR
jgi:hypothetical protein